MAYKEFVSQEEKQDALDRRSSLESRKAWLEDLKAKGEATKKQEKELARFKHALDVEENAKIREQKLKDQEEINRQQLLGAKTAGEKMIAAGKVVSEKLKESFTTNLDETLSAAAKTLTSKLDPIIESYIQQQQVLSAHLNGSASSLKSLTDNLQTTLAATNIVKQENVYKNLTNLVKAGIISNVEQRAFLQTLAQDIDLTFNASDGTLTRLLRIQQKDSTANKLAIQYSLQTFLNQNYENSQYIKDAFTDISNSLLETQSLLTPTAGLQLEATLQTWLGSMYSGGVSNATVTGLAQAINAIGSGDVSNLGTGISNLVLMGVAKAGLDYGSLLTNGINADNVSDIMWGVTQYLTEMGENSSNVVKSQLSSVFGVNIADLRAIRNLKSTESGATDNIYDALLNKYDDLIPAVVSIRNVLENIQYTMGTEIADDSFSYMTYRISELIADNLGKALDGYEIEAGFLGSGMKFNLGKIIQAAPLLGMIPGLISTIGDVSMFLSGSGNSGAAGIFNALGAAYAEQNLLVKAAGAGLGTTAGSTTSSSIYMGSGNSSDILNSSMNSSNDFVSNNYTSSQDSYTATDIYNKMMLWETAFPSNKYKIDPEENVVKVNYEDENVMLEAVQSINSNVQAILNAITSASTGQQGYNDVFSSNIW